MPSQDYSAHLPDLCTCFSRSNLPHLIIIHQKPQCTNDLLSQSKGQDLPSPFHPQKRELRVGAHPGSRLHLTEGSLVEPAIPTATGIETYAATEPAADFLLLFALETLDGVVGVRTLCASLDLQYDRVRYVEGSLFRSASGKNALKRDRDRLRNPGNI